MTMSDNDQDIHGFPAQVRLAQPSNRESLTDLARQRANDATVFDDADLFFWSAIISNTRLDSYFTHMARSSLENYARMAADGVSFQNSHHWDELPLGASLTGRVEDLESGLVQVVSDFYTLAGLNLNSLSTDQFIRGVRSGLVKDVSIGWSGGTRTCDIDGLNYMRCPHYAGMMYEIEENGVIRQVRATVAIDNATLHEVSAVYDGATPGAVILKARAAAADGRLRNKEAEVLERMYRVSIPITRQFGGVEVEETQKGARAMGLETVLDKHKIGNGLEAEARATALDSRLAELVAAESKLATAQGDLATANARVKELEGPAADGVQYRNDLIEEALAEGVRARGDQFNREVYEQNLRSSNIAYIKTMRDDWKAAGDARFPGGRKTSDSHEPKDKKAAKTAADRVPDSAFHV